VAALQMHVHSTVVTLAARLVRCACVGVDTVQMSNLRPFLAGQCCGVFPDISTGRYGSRNKARPKVSHRLSVGQHRVWGKTGRNSSRAPASSALLLCKYTARVFAGGVPFDLLYPQWLQESTSEEGGRYKRHLEGSEEGGVTLLIQSHD